MVEAGSLEMTATLDTTDVERGNRRVTQGLNNVQSETLATNSTFNKMSGTVGTLSKALAGVATAGLGSLTAIGLKSPVVADELANIQVSMFELSNTVGRQLEPALNTVDELIGLIDRGLQGGGADLFGGVIDIISNFPLAVLEDINNGIQLFQNLTKSEERDKSKDKSTVNIGGKDVQKEDVPSFGKILSLGAEKIGDEGFTGILDDVGKGFLNLIRGKEFTGGTPYGTLFNNINQLRELDRKQTALNTAD